MLWIGEDEVSRGVVKIKSLSYHNEEFIKRTELIEGVKELIAANPVLLTQEE